MEQGLDATGMYQSRHRSTKTQRSYGWQARPGMGRLSVVGKLVGVLVAVLYVSALVAGPASADEQNGHTSTACLYERYWSEACGAPWVISIAQEDAMNHPHAQWHPKTYRVKRHDTLWRISVRFCGGTEHDGQKWRQLARANHVQGTRIYVGQILRLRCTR